MAAVDGDLAARALLLSDKAVESMKVETLAEEEHSLVSIERKLDDLRTWLEKRLPEGFHSIASDAGAESRELEMSRVLSMPRRRRPSVSMPMRVPSKMHPTLPGVHVAVEVAPMPGTPDGCLPGDESFERPIHGPGPPLRCSATAPLPLEEPPAVPFIVATKRRQSLFRKISATGQSQITSMFKYDMFNFNKDGASSKDQRPASGAAPAPESPMPPVRASCSTTSSVDVGEVDTQAEPEKRTSTSSGDGKRPKSKKAWDNDNTDSPTKKRGDASYSRSGKFSDKTRMSLAPTEKKSKREHALSWLEERLKEIAHLHEIAKHQRGWSFIHGPRFQLAVSFVILLHSLLTGYGASLALAAELNGSTSDNLWVDYAELCFCAFFAMELIARIYIERACFLFGPEWRWNYFDSLLVSLSLVDVVLNGTEAGQVASVMVGRMARLARFFCLMRISRVMRHLPSLRILLFSIVDSLSSLAWCFLFIGFLMYAFSILVVYGAAEYFRSHPLDDPKAVELREWWGSLYTSMFTLYQAVSGGCDWKHAVIPLRYIHPIYEPLFGIYIFVMTFGVLNVVVGAFVAVTTQVASEDKEALVKYETSRLESYTDRIKGFFKEADVDKSGTLSWDEFRTHLEDPKVKAYFQALDLDVSQAHILFELLDTDCSDQVTVDEFIDGCLRLRGEARSVDLNMLVFMCSKMFAVFDQFMQDVDYRFDQMDIQGMAPAMTSEG